jgi:hypothetical protein
MAEIMDRLPGLKLQFLALADCSKLRPSLGLQSTASAIQLQAGQQKALEAGRVSHDERFLRRACSHVPQLQ